VAAAIGMDHQDQVRVATALSEVGRQLLTDDGGASVAFEVRLEPRPALAIVLIPQGVFGTEGVQAAARLMDNVETRGDEIVLTRHLPGQVSAERIESARVELEASKPTSAVEELSVQNRQLNDALEEVQAQRDQLLQLNAELEETNHGVMALYRQLSEELEETNRGVVALYAELEERSGQLREASEAKTRLLANVSHELRAPVTAVIGLTRLLLDARSDPLTEEQTHQLQLVQTSAADLLARVNDLLDLAKAESGQIEPQWVDVDLAAMFGQLRGTLRPMAKPGVELEVEDVSGTIESDEVLLTQIVRNLLTNALKFTVEGEVRLRAENRGEHVDLVVADTGIGIPPDEQSRVFEEFHQVRRAQQIGGNGTGLGLPYARRLTALLGGELTMSSEPGRGSVFTVTLPVRRAKPEPSEDLPHLDKVLVAVADAAGRQQLTGLLAGLVGAVVEATDEHSAIAMAERERPDAVFVDGIDLAPVDVHETPIVAITNGEPVPGATVTMRRSEVNAGVVMTVLRAIAAVDEP
jgi:signal transduction histidine kinase